MLLVSSLLLSSALACAPIIQRQTVGNFGTVPTTSSTTSPAAPMNADYYDDINPHLTKIEPLNLAFTPAFMPKMEKGSMVLMKPAQPKPVFLPLLPPILPPKPLVAPVLRDVRPLPLEKHAKTFPSFFDFFKPANFPTFPPIKDVFGHKADTPFGYVPRLQSPVSRKTVFKFRTSPPVSWTYCEPICGSGDQAVDSENAFDNAQLDIKEGLAQVFSLQHLPPLRDDQVQYTAKSTRLEEFGKGFDYTGYRYETIGNAVAFRRHKSEAARNGAFYVEVKVEIQHNNINSAVLKQVANKLFSFLQLSKGARLPEAIEVISE